MNRLICLSTCEKYTYAYRRKKKELIPVVNLLCLVDDGDDVRFLPDIFLQQQHTHNKKKRKKCAYVPLFVLYRDQTAKKKKKKKKFVRKRIISVDSHEYPFTKRKKKHMNNQGEWSKCSVFFLFCQYTRWVVKQNMC